MSIFYFENLSDESRQLARTARAFSECEILPNTSRIEAKEGGLLAALLKKAGEIGLLMTDIPEEFGGLGLSRVSSTVVLENMTDVGSFAVTFACHTGIGTIPLIYFGREEQKKKYLPKLATGEMISAYALTEPQSGSDALSIRTRATISPDGKYYLLNGEKIFCTNANIADLIIIFAKVQGEHFTAFLVERNTPGLSFGREEVKMGLHGSSTASVILNDAKVPIENVLGELGKGHKIAFDTLNLGRFKLGSACLGNLRRVMEEILPYVKERKQFGRPIAEFGLIRQKIAQIACLTYVLESLIYRIAGQMDDQKDSSIAVVESLATSAAIAKVYGSEALAFAADEAVQIFGGYGFISDYAVERYYRDCRVYRIFEGTNEICRLLIASQLMRGLDGNLASLEKIGDASPDVLSLIEEAGKLACLVRLVAQKAGSCLGEAIKIRQTVAGAIADLAIESVAYESAVARAALLEQTKHKMAGHAANMCRYYAAWRGPALRAIARQTFNNIAEKTKISGLEALQTDADKLCDEIVTRILSE